MLIDVAICVRPGSGTLRVCLAALSATGVVRPLLMSVRRGRGLAEARNEALAKTRADVLAFVDDDVAVDHRWLHALRGAWGRAPADRACVGGPIGVRFLAPRPQWLGDDLLGALGVANAGTTFHGGNVSFRADALRGVGGFWPARGRPELHDWFSEEHHAQRELAAAGWSAERADDASAERLIDATHLTRLQVLGSRGRCGARSALIGERRPRPAAARAMASSIAGVAVAAARRNEALVVERAARVAENAGVLLAPLIAHRDLQPVATHTPFRHSIPPAQPLFLRRRRRLPTRAPVVLVYHRVDDEARSGVTRARFAAHLDVVTSEYTPVPLELIVAGAAPRDAVAVTFDDVYAQTIRNVLPALEASGVPATVFVSTGYLDHATGFWWDEVPRLVRGAHGRPLRLTVNGESRAWADAAAAERHLIEWFQPLTPEAIDGAIDDLRAWADEVPSMPDAERPLTTEELRSVAASPLIELGSHTQTHANLRWSDSPRRLAELVGSRQDLASRLGIDPPRGLAYPFGVPGADVDSATMMAAKDAGFGYAVLNSPGRITAATDRYALPRVAPEHLDTDAFAELMRRTAR